LSSSPVALVVGLCCQVAEQLVEVVVRYGQDDLALLGPRPVDDPLALGVQHHDLPEACRQLFGDADVLRRAVRGESLAAQVIRCTQPATDRAQVSARGALPGDRRRGLGALHPDATGATAVAGPTLTRQRRHPARPRVTCGGCPNDAAQLLSQASGRSRHVVRQVEEVAQIGNEHRADGIRSGRNTSEAHSAVPGRPDRWQIARTLRSRPKTSANSLPAVT